jgi:hypothetical protein
MSSSGMLRRVALIGTDISEECTNVTRIAELGSTSSITETVADFFHSDNGDDAFL